MSERLIVDPLESIIKNTYLYINLADRNAVGAALVRLGGVIEIAELCPIHDSGLITSKLAVCIVHQILGMLAVGQGCRVDPSVRREPA